MARDIIILMRENPFRGPLEGYRDREQAWSSINHSILSARAYREGGGFERRGVG
jgi:hypothetical protein